jgi:hypothetical protein
MKTNIIIVLGIIVILFFIFNYFRLKEGLDQQTSPSTQPSSSTQPSTTPTSTQTSPSTQASPTIASSTQTSPSTQASPIIASSTQTSPTTSTQPSIQPLITPPTQPSTQPSVQPLITPPTQPSTQPSIKSYIRKISKKITKPSKQTSPSPYNPSSITQSATSSVTSTYTSPSLPPYASMPLPYPSANALDQQYMSVPSLDSMDTWKNFNFPTNKTTINSPDNNVFAIGDDTEYLNFETSMIVNNPWMKFKGEAMSRKFTNSYISFPNTYFICDLDGSYYYLDNFNAIKKTVDIPSASNISNRSYIYLRGIADAPNTYQVISCKININMEPIGFLLLDYNINDEIVWTTSGSDGRSFSLSF